MSTKFKLITRAEDYTEFLETQLENISHACQKLEGFGSRLKEVESTVSQLNTRVLGMSRVLKIQQDSSDSSDIYRQELLAQIRDFKHTERLMKEFEYRLSQIVNNYTGDEA